MALVVVVVVMEIVTPQHGRPLLGRSKALSRCALRWKSKKQICATSTLTASPHMKMTRTKWEPKKLRQVARAILRCSASLKRRRSGERCRTRLPLRRPRRGVRQAPLHRGQDTSRHPAATRTGITCMGRCLHSKLFLLAFKPRKKKPDVDMRILAFFFFFIFVPVCQLACSTFLCVRVRVRVFVRCYTQMHL